MKPSLSCCVLKEGTHWPQHNCVHGQAHFQCGTAVAGSFLVVGKMELPTIGQEVMQIYLWPQSSAR